MEIFYSKDKVELKNKFFEFSSKVVENSEFSCFGVCGGLSIVSFLSVFYEKKYSLLKTHFFLADERCVSIYNKESNFKMLNDNFFNKMVSENLISKSNLHPFIYNEKDDLNSIYNYNLEFSSRFNNLDIVILSAGEDGHIASIFPSRKLLFSEIEGYQYEIESPKFPQKRISLTPKTLEMSKAVILFFIGDIKKQALENFLSYEIAIKNCPAKLLKEHNNLLVITNIEGRYGRS